VRQAIPEVVEIGTKTGLVKVAVNAESLIDRFGGFLLPGHEQHVGVLRRRSRALL
jgi:hypothetical protein